MPDTKQSILLGALVTGILGTSYLGLITTQMCCMNVIAGALVAIWHYTETNELTISGGKAAGMGALVAVGGSVIASVLTLILMTAGIRHDVVMAEFMLNNLGDQLPPESIQGLEDQVEAAIQLGPFFFNVLVSTAVSSAFGAGAGAIGAKMFKKGGDEPTDLSVIEEL
ncbi:MAG: hypothetical protein O2797_01895 [Bacteroidetes bacterium]|nr:hypothetical protein [Bacteroidota bacterium]